MSIIFYIIISLIIIYLLHQICIYFINTYSEKKINRILDSQVDQYKQIIENLTKEKLEKLEKLEEIEEIDQDILKQDLETFLNTLSNT
jgi:hypothetical protein